MIDVAAARKLLATFLSAEELRRLSDTEVQFLARVAGEALPDVPEDQPTQHLATYRSRVQQLLDDRSTPEA